MTTLKSSESLEKIVSNKPLEKIVSNKPLEKILSNKSIKKTDKEKIEDAFEKAENEQKNLTLKTNKNTSLSKKSLHSLKKKTVSLHQKKTPTYIQIIIATLMITVIENYYILESNRLQSKRPGLGKPSFFQVTAYILVKYIIFGIKFVRCLEFVINQIPKNISELPNFLRMLYYYAKQNSIPVLSLITSLLSKLASNSTNFKQLVNKDHNFETGFDSTFVKNFNLYHGIGLEESKELVPYGYYNVKNPKSVPHDDHYAYKPESYRLNNFKIELNNFKNVVRDLYNVYIGSLSVDKFKSFHKKKYF
jgi:hypothetical protein